MALGMSGRGQLILLAAAATVAVLTAVTCGPLAVARLIPRRLHLVLDGVVAVALAVSPLAMGRDRTLTAVIVAEAAAVALLRLATLSVRRRTSTGDGDADGRGAGPTAGPAPTTPPGPDYLVTSARALGALGAGARRHGPAVERALQNGARRLGRAVGRASR
jgi:hypothetical protein